MKPVIAEDYGCGRKCTPPTRHRGCRETCPAWAEYQEAKNKEYEERAKKSNINQTINEYESATYEKARRSRFSVKYSRSK